MGRRSSHTPEQLRELIIDAATDLLRQDGLDGLSARAVAKRIGYSPGTIYNVFHDLDELLFTIQNRMLDRLAAHMAKVRGETGVDATDELSTVATAYVDFALQNPRLWGLLLEHQPKRCGSVPLEFRDRLTSLMLEIERAVVPLMGNETSYARQVSTALWASIHGIVTLATSAKVGHVTDGDARQLVDHLIATYAGAYGLKGSRRTGKLRVGTV